jgi:hypothetical protein
MTSMAQPARRTAGRARDSSVQEALTRGGFVGYGLLHLAVGWLALLLVVVAVGLLAMAMWQALEAAVGHRAETGGRRVAERISSAARAVVYAVLAWTAAGFVAFGGYCFFQSRYRRV